MRSMRVGAGAHQLARAARAERCAVSACSLACCAASRSSEWLMCASMKAWWVAAMSSADGGRRGMRFALRIRRDAAGQRHARSHADQGSLEPGVHESVLGSEKGVRTGGTHASIPSGRGRRRLSARYRRVSFCSIKAVHAAAPRRPRRQSGRQDPPAPGARVRPPIAPAVAQSRHARPPAGSDARASREARGSRRKHTVSKRAGAPPTIIDVAKQAGVSIKTVSRVMNKEATVHPDTRAKVLKVVAALKYRPQLSARSLAGAKSFLIGLLYFEPSAAFVAGVQRGATARCRQSDYHLVVESLQSDDADLRSRIDHMLAALRPDGMILTPPICDHPGVLAALRAGEHAVQGADLARGRWPWHAARADGRRARVRGAREPADQPGPHAHRLPGPRRAGQSASARATGGLRARDEGARAWPSTRRWCARAPSPSSRVSRPRIGC